MTQMLASVTGADEAALALAAGADIVDLKDPQRGALGALALPVLRETVAAHGRRRPLSATIGDMPPDPDRVLLAARATAATGVDYVKIGLFADTGERSSRLRTVQALGALADEGVALVAVLLADTAPDIELVPYLARAGFAGVMLDTQRKPPRGTSAGQQALGLRAVMRDDRLAAFVDLAREHDLIAGLAGSLSVEDIEPLLSIGPDILGFRGALCDTGRDSPLCVERMAKVRRSIPRHAAPRLAASSSNAAGPEGLRDAV